MSYPKAEIPLTSLYQAELFKPYSKQLIHGFTGKPASFGGPDSKRNPASQVSINRTRLLSKLGLSEEIKWVSPQQIHGHRVGRVGDKSLFKTDAVLLTEPDKPVMLSFADCLPVLLYDPIQHGGAVIHAGWRGTAQCIAEETVLAMQNVFGSKPEDILAAIGPAIGLCCFQVSLDVAETLAISINSSLKELELIGFLAWDSDYPENPRLDLKALNRFQLESAGIIHIETLSDCTFCNKEKLFSYRRGDDGRNSAFMMLK